MFNCSWISTRLSGMPRGIESRPRLISWRIGINSCNTKALSCLAKVKDLLIFPKIDSSTRTIPGFDWCSISIIASSGNRSGLAPSPGMMSKARLVITNRPPSCLFFQRFRKPLVLLVGNERRTVSLAAALVKKAAPSFVTVPACLHASCPSDPIYPGVSSSSAPEQTVLIVD